jgi:hypothetical protein
MSEKREMIILRRYVPYGTTPQNRFFDANDKYILAESTEMTRGFQYRLTLRGWQKRNLMTKTKRWRDVR